MAAARSSGGSAAKALSLRHAETFHATSFSTPQTMPQNSAGRTAPQQRHVSLDAAELSDSEYRLVDEPAEKLSRTVATPSSANPSRSTRYCSEALPGKIGSKLVDTNA